MPLRPRHPDRSAQDHRANPSGLLTGGWRCEQGLRSAGHSLKAGIWKQHAACTHCFLMPNVLTCTVFSRLIIWRHGKNNSRFWTLHGCLPIANGAHSLLFQIWLEGADLCCRRGNGSQGLPIELRHALGDACSKAQHVIDIC